ncbi:zeta toxin family protein [Clostridium oceanicum]|uniref:UDP-N-acetylglucosamine kinase n=1 Tax=Clostridium oceanicum TaxID=1543 RepID=A0ABN1JBL0_9CLOT
MATYTIFAGVNGAGKTSIYKSTYYKENKDEKRINTDEMVSRIGSWKDNNLQIKCAREAIKLINYYIRNHISFNQETTLSGKSIIRNIKKAKQNGFYIVMNYIGVDSPEIAKERVEIRVLKGGHGIPKEAIQRRYYESLDNLKQVLNLCDEVNIYDNTKSIEEIAYLINGIIEWKSENIPKWSEEIFKKL